MKKIYNIFALSVVALVGLSLTACSEDDYDTNPYNKSGVNLLAFGPSPNTRSQEIRITGTNLTAVDKVVFAGGTLERGGKTIQIAGAEVEKANFNSVDNENIYVNIPEETVPGKIKLVAGNETITSEGTLTFKEAITVTSISPLTGLNAGDEISIKGDYVYNIAEVIFTSGVAGAPVAAEDFTYVSRKEVRLLVPLAAESGVITMNDGADWELEFKEPAEVLTASVNSLTPNADFGEKIQITGNNLHTVESVLFPGGVSAEFTISDDNKTITATVPAECKSGTLSLLLYSGAAISTPEFAVPTIKITSVTPDKDLVEGDVVTMTGENFDRVIGVNLPGIGDIIDYDINGNTLTFTVPEGMTDGKVVLTQNAYITADAIIEVRKLTGVIWMGKEDLTGWSNFGVFNWDGDKWTKFQEAISGAGELTFHFKQISDNPAFNLRMGDWSTPFSDISLPYGDGGNIYPGAGVEDVVINLTAEEREAMFADGGKGFVIWGDGIQLQYIKFIASGAAKDLADYIKNMDGSGIVYPYGFTWDDTGRFILSKEFLLETIGVQSGWVFEVYKEKSSTGQVQINNSSWSALYTIADWNGTEEVLVQPFDAVMMEAVNNGGLVIQGDLKGVTKLTIHP